MSAQRKYGRQQFRERAVRMCRERLAEPRESKRGARRHVGMLLVVRGCCEIAAACRSRVRGPGRSIIDHGEGLSAGGSGSAVLLQPNMGEWLPASDPVWLVIDRSRR